MSLVTPLPNRKDRLQNKARDEGWECPKCRSRNLPHRKRCFRCNKRGQLSDKQTEAFNERMESEQRAAEAKAAGNKLVAQLDANRGLAIFTNPGQVRVAIVLRDRIKPKPVGLREQQAMADLFCAAPELLEALETLAAGLEWFISSHPTLVNDSDHDALQQANLALAKARGRE